MIFVSSPSKDVSKAISTEILRREVLNATNRKNEYSVDARSGSERRLFSGLTYLGRFLRAIHCSVAGSIAVFALLFATEQANAAVALVNNATFVSQNVPLTMTVGQTYAVSVTMKNSGTTTWVTAATNSGSFRLGSQNLQDNKTWGANRIPLIPSISPGTTLAPAQTAIFSFSVTAPTVAGTYNFQWQMVQDGVAWFGDQTTNLSIVVSSHGVAPTMTMTAPLDGDKYYNATGTSMVSVNGAATAYGGATITKIDVLEGTSILSTSSNTSAFGRVLQLGNGTHNILMRATDSQNNVGQSAAVTITVGPPPLLSSSASMALTNCTSFSPTASPTPASMTCMLSNTGNSATNSISYSTIPGVSVTGPTGACAAGAACGTVLITTTATPGTYSGTLNVYPNLGYVASTNVNLTVTAALINGATFVSQSAPGPLPLIAGQTYPVKVVMKNTGTTTWTTAARYSLGAANPNDNTVWDSSSRVPLPLDASTNLPSPVAPGNSATFSFTVTAPAAPGTYNYQWQMVQDGVAWIGDVTLPLSLIVVTQDPKVAWQGLMSAFSTGNVAAVEALFLDPTKYDAVLQAMGTAQMANVPGSLSTISFIEIGPEFATAVVDQTSNGVILRHYVSFILVNGAWYIADF